MLPLHHVQMDGRLAVVKGETIGVWNPATVLGEDNEGTPYIYGPIGLVPLVCSSTLHQEIAWLAGARAVLLANSPASATAVASLLDNNETSRTVSYLCCSCATCEELLSRLERIKQARVIVVGCGGIGATATMILAGAGVQNLVLVDFDHVELSNLNRQLFWTAQDVGHKKVSVLARAIRSRFPNVSIVAREQSLQDAESIASCLRGCQAALFTADDPIGIDRLARNAAASVGVFLVSAGYTAMREGVLNWGIRKDKLSVVPSRNMRWFASDGAIAPSYGPLNVELAGQAAGLIMAWLMGQLDLQANGTHCFDADEYPRHVHRARPEDS